MREYLKFYIDGAWIDPVTLTKLDVINPATEAICGQIALGSGQDVDRAVLAARRAFSQWSTTSVAERIALLERIAHGYEARFADLAAAITEEMGAPVALAHKSQVPIGMVHITTTIDILRGYVFAKDEGNTRIVKEAIGVCAMITPWNWPLNQICAKVLPALATGCTMVLKPSEVAPFSGQIFAEIMHDAGVPAGVFNMVHGDGPGVGVPLSSHREVDMVSFTGSTRAGVAVAQNAAPTVKRVAQELGGKSPNIILDDAVFAESVAAGVRNVMQNSGQSCNAPTRMFVPAHRMAEAASIAHEATTQLTVGDPLSDADLGPVVSEVQFSKIQSLIAKGIDEGATLVAGGTERPSQLTKGYFVRPTIFGNVTNDMTIAREEIFGPVLAILGYDSLESAIVDANDTEYGLAAYVSGADQTEARRLATQLRAGQVIINGASDRNAPFGGYKMSGNGREWGRLAFEEYLETKAILGYATV